MQWTEKVQTYFREWAKSTSFCKRIIGDKPKRIEVACRWNLVGVRGEKIEAKITFRIAQGKNKGKLIFVGRSRGFIEWT